ncbi:MAG: polysaccharide biosynthesis tyrosine autokinase [bacterium]
MGQYDINLRDYWRIIRKRKIIIIFTTVVLGFFSFIFAKLNEPAPIYSTSSAIRIDQNIAVSGIVGDGALGGGFQDISTQTAVIRSYPVIERVAKELGLIDKSIPSDDIAKNSRLVSIINGLAGQVDSEQVGDTNIISIRVTSGDPDQAARMANTIAVVYRQFDYESRNEAILKQFTFIDTQLKDSEKRLRESEERIKKYKEDENFLSLSVEATFLSRSIEVLSQKVSGLRKFLIKVRGAMEQISSIGEFRTGSTERIPVDDIDPVLARLNNQLVEHQVKRDTLLENFTDNHPIVRELSLQIKNSVREMLLILQGREKSFQTELTQREKELEKKVGRNKAIPNLGLELQRRERQLATDMEVHTLLRQKSEEVKIKVAGTQHLIHIVKPAFRPTVRDNPPQLGVNTFVGALLGLIVGVVFAFVLETMDTSIGAIEDVESYLEVPVLGVIPILDLEELEREYLENNPDRGGRFAAEMYGRLVTHFVPRSPISEAYRSFRTQMDFISLERGGNTFVITSSTPGEGKTTTAINFAITYAQTNKRTLLMDGDMRKPTVYRVFGIDREPGLTEILLGNNTLDDSVRTMTDIMLGKFDMEDIMLTPGLDNLNILTCGHIPPNPAELLNSPRMAEFLEELREQFDIIVIDTPPLLPVTDAAILGARVDGCIIVYKVGAIARGALKRAKIQLENVRAPVWGVVLNAMRAETSPDVDTFRYQSGYYYGGYTEEAGETADLALLPFYQRWYRQAKEVILPSAEGDVLEQEASLLARILGAALIGTSVALIAAGILWQMGIDMPVLGSRRSMERRIGLPPGGALPDLERTWIQIGKPPKPSAPDAPAPPAAPAPGAAAPKRGPSLEKPPPAKPRRGASLPPKKGPPLFRRASLPLAGDGGPSPLIGQESGRRPFGIIVSVNRKGETTRRQLKRLRRAGLHPGFIRVPAPGGTLERVFVGAFESRAEAERFLRERLLSITPEGEKPYVARLPYALEVARGLAPGETDIIRVILKGAGLHAYPDPSGEAPGRLLLGAFRKPTEAAEAGRLLRREAISFRLVTR